MKKTKLNMANFWIGLLLALSISFAVQARGNKSIEKMPMDIRVYMSILAKKGNMLTDYEKNYMENLGHGDIREMPVDGKTFHNAFINEIENESQAMQAFEAGRKRREQEQEANPK